MVDQLFSVAGVNRSHRDMGDGTFAEVVMADLGEELLDSFGRVRVSSPSYVFDAQLTYDLHPLLFEQLTAQSGATIAHDATNRCALLTFSSTPAGGRAIMQSYEHFRYQPGRSHVAKVTFNFRGGVANALKFSGLSDGVNGMELQLNGPAPRVAIYSASGVGNQFVGQSQWRDPLDGTGPSGIVVDWTKTQLLHIDLQALYVGRVRFYLAIGGVLIKFCEVNNANIQADPFLQTANLPVRCGMTCSGEVSTTMNYICSSVVSEGGQLDELGIPQSVTGTELSTVNGTAKHLMSIRPKTTFNSIANRVKFDLKSIDGLATSGSSPILLQFCIGQALTAPSWTSVGDNSAFEYDVAGTVNGAPFHVFHSAWLPAGGAKPAIAQPLRSKLPITLDAAGAVRANGVLSVLATGIGGSPNCRMSLNWSEIR